MKLMFAVCVYLGPMLFCSAGRIYQVPLVSGCEYISADDVGSRKSKNPADKCHS